MSHRSSWWGANVQGWRAATDKHHTVARFRREGIPHMDTIALCRPDPDTARDAFHQLGRDIWTRPRIGLGGQDVFHVTTVDDLHRARRYYAALGQDWLASRDARNINHHGHRHQFRVVVLGDQVLRVCEHVQSDPDAPCNESRGAVSTTIAVGDFPLEFAQLAISATRSLGLPFGGVDLAIENGGVVFEVNVHPVIDVPSGLETSPFRSFRLTYHPASGRPRSPTCGDHYPGGGPTSEPERTISAVQCSSAGMHRGLEYCSLGASELSDTVSDKITLAFVGPARGPFVCWNLALWRWLQNIDCGLGSGRFWRSDRVSGPLPWILSVTEPFRTPKISVTERDTTSGYPPSIKITSGLHPNRNKR